MWLWYTSELINETCEQKKNKYTYIYLYMHVGA